MSQFITSTLENGVQTITFNRADKFNSFIREMAMAFQAELRSAEEHKAVRAIVITGNGKAFCAGQDLGEAIDPKWYGAHQNRERTLKSNY